ncbi:unnamed protein product [Psylliodes chrysocephalus]|uniref:Uncharacterized protein n=1 Tax=Psylliodes chrysocephalus TaxID=3402493 RepID=A0A9P0CK69_9CUCU|nr:unnamed protein product [Psylliodes chrysocephala]
MELSKGVCFFCSNTKIITKSAKTVIPDIKLFLNDSAIDQDQLNDIKPLKVCPMCYHKIHLLVKLDKNISSTAKNGTYNCTLCGSLDDIIKVNKWETFDKISSDFPVLAGNTNLVCSACLFSLDTRHFMKEKLISVYPNLRIEVKIPKFDDNITSHSTPISKKREKTSKSELKSFSIKSRTSDAEKRNLDVSSINIKPLSQQSTDIKLLEIVKQDQKFMNQVLIVKLQSSLEKKANFVKLETGTNVRRSRNSKDNKTQDIMEVEENNEFMESQVIKEVSKQRKNNKEVTDNITVTKDKSIMKDLRKKRSRIVEISSDSGEESKVDIKKKQFFKIKLNQKAKKSAKKEIQVKQKLTESIPEFKRNLSIKLEQMKMSEKNIRDEDTNVIESEDSIDLELKSDDDSLSPVRRIETEAANDSFDIVKPNQDEKIDISGIIDQLETSGDNETQSTEENTQTTNEDSENLDISVKAVTTKEKITEQNGLIKEKDSEKCDEIADKVTSLQEVKPDETDIEAVEKSESEENVNKNEEPNCDNEVMEKHESKETKNTEELHYYSDDTEKNSDVDENVTKDDVQIGESDEGATSKSEENSAVDENNVEEDTAQNGNDAKQDDLSQEVDNDSQENDKDQSTQESADVSLEDFIKISTQNSDEQKSETETDLEGFTTISELPIEDHQPVVVTLDSTQEEDEGDAGKRKRCDSVSDSNRPIKKLKRVTFDDDLRVD